ncbi:MAG: long-chain fatty acid--CoA ligase [Fuerstiella sp.]|nr:long-chain fatty acid--CoA ligase [Fuerstiella sp.]
MNIGKFLTRSARSIPQNPAIIHGSKMWTYAEFNERVNRLAGALAGLGVSKGDHVALLMYNGPQMLEAMFACFKAGFGAVPINFRLHPNEFTFIIDQSESKVVVATEQFNLALKQRQNQMSTVRHFITTSGAEEGLLDYETVLSESVSEFEDVDLAPDDVAWLFYTSGTTGQPKGAMLTQRNLTAMTMNCLADMCPGCGPDDVTLHAAPLSHGSGLYAVPNVARAATHVIPDSTSFDPAGVLRLIEQHRVTNIFVAPTMLKRLIDCPELDHCDLSSLKSVIYGGAPMLAEDLTTAIAKLGPCLVQLYGQGESPMTITYLPHRDHVVDGDHDQNRRLASVGIPRTDVEVAVVDENGHPLPSGSSGEIVTRSDMVMKGYWQNTEATAASLKNGWLYTGDIGCFDEYGYLFLMDRSKDMIISGGENIYPREIEEVLVRHPAVREVAVIGVPDPEWGESVKAVVSTTSGNSVTGQELIDFCRQHVSSYKKPRSVDFVDEIPRNNYGKMMKRVLREKYTRKT